MINQDDRFHYQQMGTQSQSEQMEMMAIETITVDTSEFIHLLAINGIK